MGIEPTARFWRATGFEDQEGHQTLIASVVTLIMYIISGQIGDNNALNPHHSIIFISLAEQRDLPCDAFTNRL